MVLCRLKGAGESVDEAGEAAVGDDFFCEGEQELDDENWDLKRERKEDI